MKNLKIVFASLLVTAGVIMFSSFVSKSYDDKAFARVCYRVKATTGCISTALLNAGNAAEILRFKNINNWQSFSTSEPPSVCTNSVCACVICFNTEDYPTWQAVLDFLAAGLADNSINIDHNGTYGVGIKYYEQED